MEISSIDYEKDDCYKVIMTRIRSGSLLLPVDKLSSLHVNHILHFPAYVTFLSDDALVDLGKRLVEYALSSGHTDRCTYEVSELVSSICNAELLDAPGSHLLLETVSRIIVVEALKEGKEGRECILLNRMSQEYGVLPLALKKLFLNTLFELLTSDCSDSNPSNEANYLALALSTQVKFWSRDQKPFRGSGLVQQLTSKVRKEEIFDTIWNLISEAEDSASWDLVFHVLSDVNNRNPSPVFKKGAERKLVEAVDERNRAKVIVSLALLRVCCSGATEYGAWNTALLTLLPSQPSFVFYIDCLSHIVPVEPTICLKVHINKVPPAPPGAHSALADYLALVRARLSELQETTDWGGLFGDDDDGQHDVKRVLAYFESTNGQVPAAVMEASVFRKDYYERVFLRRLMDHAVKGKGNGAAGLLLSSLYQSGKCPASIYKEYMMKTSSAAK